MPRTTKRDAITEEAKAYAEAVLLPYVEHATNYNGPVDELKAYKAIAKHRASCAVWRKRVMSIDGKEYRVGCWDCFGGGVHSLIESVTTEMLDTVR